MTFNGSYRRFGIDYSKLRYIDNGTDIKASSIPNAGLGVFVTLSPIQKGDIITEYDGHVITREHAKRDALIDYRIVSHDKSIQGSGGFVIRGLRKPIPGRGAGSFINDTTTKLRERTNCTFFCPGGNHAYILPKSTRSVYNNCRVNDRVFIRATKPIPIGSELFIRYGRNNWGSRYYTL